MDIAHRKLAALSLSLPAVLVAAAAYADEGSDVAWQLQYYYSRTLDDCGVGRPLIKCSGLRVRGTDSGNPAFFPWDPSPNSKTSGGVSFSFLRKDINYQDLGLLKKNGYILKPDDLVDLENNERSKGQRRGAKETKLDTLCFFPIDAWTDYRQDAGCGDYTNPSDPVRNDKVEKICQANTPPIDTGDKWVADYKAQDGNKNSVTAHKRQCGFEIKDRKDDADAFWAGVQARRKLESDAATSDHTRKTQDEIRVPVWETGQGKELPIFAFIYTPNANTGATDAQAKKLAQDDQQRYFKETGKWVPVIQVKLPAYNDKNGATFAYNVSDQTVPAPKADPECKSYIESAEWVQRTDDPFLKNPHWSLMVKPSACGRTMTKAQQTAAYAELYSKYGTDGRWNPDNGSMYKQFVCHRENTDQGRPIANKPTWNIEPIRPNASWDEFWKQGCNAYDGSK